MEKLELKDLKWRGGRQRTVGIYCLNLKEKFRSKISSHVYIHNYPGTRKEWIYSQNCVLATFHIENEVTVIMKASKYYTWFGTEQPQLNDVNCTAGTHSRL